MLQSQQERNSFIANLNKELDLLSLGDSNCSPLQESIDDRIQNIRNRYSELLNNFPSMSTCWYSWIQFEQRSSSSPSIIEMILKRCIDDGSHGDVVMWRIYVEYFRKLVPLESSNNVEEQEVAINKQRLEIIELFERALSATGLDIDAGPLYWDYILYIEGWNSHTMYEKQLQMEQLRKIYHRAISTPLRDIEQFWNHWEEWEQSLNRLTAKKLIADRSPAYMGARAVMLDLKGIIDALPCKRNTFSSLSDTHLAPIMTPYRRWLEWELNNPLGLPINGRLLHERIDLVFRTAILTGPLYRSGILWFKWFKYQEKVLKLTGTSIISSDSALSIIKRASQYVLPQDPSLCICLAEYLEERSINNPPPPPLDCNIEDNVKNPTPRDVYESFISRYQEDGKESLSLLFINFMSFERRNISGLGGARALFTRARKLPPKMGACNHLVFIEAARQEYCCAIPSERHKHLMVATKIMELGMSRYAENVAYVEEYLSFLLDKCSDEANASALFERFIDQINRNSLMMEDPTDYQYESLKIWRLMIRWSWDNWTPLARNSLLERFSDNFSKNPRLSIDDFTLWSEGKRLKGEDVDFWCHKNGDIDDVEDFVVQESIVPFCISKEIMFFMSKLPSNESYSSLLVPSKGLIDLLLKISIPSNFDDLPSTGNMRTLNPGNGGNSGSSSSSTTRKRTSRQVNMAPIALGRRKTQHNHRDFDPSAPRERDDDYYRADGANRGGEEDIFAHRRR